MASYTHRILKFCTIRRVSNDVSKSVRACRILTTGSAKVYANEQILKQGWVHFIQVRNILTTDFPDCHEEISLDESKDSVKKGPPCFGAKFEVRAKFWACCTHRPIRPLLLNEILWGSLHGDGGSSHALLEGQGDRIIQWHEISGSVILGHKFWCRLFQESLCHLRSVAWRTILNEDPFLAKVLSCPREHPLPKVADVGLAAQMLWSVQEYERLHLPSIWCHECKDLNMGKLPLDSDVLRIDRRIELYWVPGICWRSCQASLVGGMESCAQRWAPHSPFYSCYSETNGSIISSSLDRLQKTLQFLSLESFPSQIFLYDPGHGCPFDPHLLGQALHGLLWILLIHLSNSGDEIKLAPPMKGHWNMLFLSKH